MTAKWILPLVLLVSTKVFAYNFTQDFNDGFYWQSLVIPMTVVEADVNGGQYLKAIVDDAVDAWESSLGQQLWNISPIVQASDVGGNLIKWVSAQRISEL